MARTIAIHAISGFVNISSPRPHLLLCFIRDPLEEFLASRQVLSAPHILCFT